MACHAPPNLSVFREEPAKLNMPNVRCIQRWEVAFYRGLTLSLSLSLRVVLTKLIDIVVLVALSLIHTQSIFFLTTFTPGPSRRVDGSERRIVSPCSRFNSRNQLSGDGWVYIL